ncbi:MAG: hypothetical protein WCF57_01525 [Pyrinomonadaceae bacterium]
MSLAETLIRASTDSPALNSNLFISRAGACARRRAVREAETCRK